MDSEVQHEVWASRIPLQFTLAHNEVLVQRITYFPLVLEHIHAYFAHFVDPAAVDELWLEYNGEPLKWHIPVGVLYDLLKLDETLPWQITVHLTNFPSENVMRMSAVRPSSDRAEGTGDEGGKARAPVAQYSCDAVESHFMQSVKEADAIRHRGEIINNMEKREHKMIWNSLCTNRYDQYWAKNKLLMENTEEHAIRALPVRVYFPGHAVSVQRTVLPMKEGGVRSIVGDVVNTLRPSDSPSITEETHTMLILGVGIQFDTPVAWLATHMTCADNFVYIVVKAI